MKINGDKEHISDNSEQKICQTKP